MNYFDYNANKYFPREARQSSCASFDVIQPPDYWVTEHGGVSEADCVRLVEAWRARAPDITRLWQK